MRNFNDNAADTKRHATGSKVRRLRQTSADEVNKNWNAGDTETAEPAVGPEGEGAAAETIRKVSIALPPGAANVEDDDDESVCDADAVEAQRSPSQEKIAKLRRLSNMNDDADTVEPSKRKPKKKRKSSTLRVCIRRCIAEDETWDLKTVPDLDMLLVKYFADNYAGTFNTFYRATPVMVTSCSLLTQ